MTTTPIKIEHLRWDPKKKELFGDVESLKRLQQVDRSGDDRYWPEFYKDGKIHIAIEGKTRTVFFRRWNDSVGMEKYTSEEFPEITVFLDY